MTRIYIGSKLGSADKIRRPVNIHIPRSTGPVTFFRDGMIIETVQTSNIREAVYDRVCGWRQVHRWADLGYSAETAK